MKYDLEETNRETFGNKVSVWRYNAFGQMTEIRRGNNTSTYYTCDIKGRLEGLLTTANHNGNTWKVQDVKYESMTDNRISAVENMPDVDSAGAIISTVHNEYQCGGLNRYNRNFFMGKIFQICPFVINQPP